MGRRTPPEPPEAFGSCVTVFGRMAASAQTAKTGRVGTYFTWIQGSDGINWQVHEGKRENHSWIFQCNFTYCISEFKNDDKCV